MGVGCWNFIEGKDNVADIPSRGIVNSKFDQTQWVNGPDWLKAKKAGWPIRRLGENIHHDESSELLKAKNVLNLSTQAKNALEDGDILKLIDVTRYSNVDKLIRVTAWVLRAVKLFKTLGKREGNCELVLETIELSLAEETLIKNDQRVFEGEQNFQKKRKSLGIFLDEKGIARCSGRLKNADIPYETKHPVLLPNDSWFTKLMIWKSHERVFHNGVKETLIDFRRKFWTIKGRQLTRKLINKCVVCRKLEGLGYAIPEMAQLPEFRVKGGKSFESVGIDFCGPLYIKTEKETMKKAYIALITCATTRMVHLELSNNLTTISLINCIKRFTARRGVPSLVISDNAKTFESKLLKAYLGKMGVTWKYNLAKSPWWGGMFERLIRSTKRCLKKSLKGGRYDYEKLSTLLAEIEAVINSRPLTYVYDDGVEEILTPSHLYMGNRLLDPPKPPPIEILELEADAARTYVEKLDKRIDGFWKRWYNEYLVNLRENFRSKMRNGQTPRVGDVVVIHEDNKRRHLWKMGKIIELIVGRDSVVRGAKVRVAGNSKRTTILERPLEKLFPLEMGEGDEMDPNVTNEREGKGEVGRVRRRAAVAGEETRRVRAFHDI